MDGDGSVVEEGGGGGAEEAGREFPFSGLLVGVGGGACTSSTINHGLWYE